MPTFSDLKPDYARLWSAMELRPERSNTVDHLARKILTHKGIYVAAQRATGVPWFLIAALHNRESGADFSTYLGNGEPLDRVTRLVPRGRGPFRSWHDGAVDALKLDGLDKVSTWTPERACYEIEKFNGFGYRKRGIPSPYLWSFSNHYAAGKYIADGVFDAAAVDRQCGAIPVLRRIMELDPSARFQAGAPIKQPAVIATAGGAIAATAHSLGGQPRKHPRHPRHLCLRRHRLCHLPAFP